MPRKKTKTQQLRGFSDKIGPIEKVRTGTDLARTKKPYLRPQRFQGVFARFHGAARSFSVRYFKAYRLRPCQAGCQPFKTAAHAAAHRFMRICQRLSADIAGLFHPGGRKGA